MKKFLSILFTMMLFLSLVACNLGDNSGENDNNVDEEQTNDIISSENEEAFKEFLAANKLMTMEELDKAYAEMVADVEYPEDMFVGKNLLVPTKAEVNLPFDEDVRHADFYLYQKENMIYLAGIPEGFEDESFSTYLDLAYLEEVYDEGKGSMPTDMKLSEIIEGLMEESGEMEIDLDVYDQLVSTFTLKGDDFTAVENGKFQLKNEVLFEKLAVISGGEMTAKDFETELKEEKADISIFVYYSDNQFKGFEVKYTQEVEEILMTASFKLGLVYSGEELSGISIDILVTDQLEAKIIVNGNDDEVSFDVEIVMSGYSKIKYLSKISEKGLELSLVMTEIYDETEMTSSIDLVITENSIDLSCKSNGVEEIALNLDVTKTKIGDTTAISLDGSFTYTSHSTSSTPDGYFESSEKNTVTFELKSGSDVVIPESAIALEDEAQDLIELIGDSMGGTSQPIWIMDCYFVSYADTYNEEFKVGDELADGTIVTDKYMNLYLTGNGEGTFYWDGYDTIEFYFDVEAFELYEEANVKFYDEKYMEIRATLVNTYEGNIIFTVMAYENGDYVGTQIYTFQNYNY